MRIYPAIATLAFLLASSPGHAGEYRISVTREDQDLYLIDGQNMIIKTRHCFQFAFSEDAFLRTTFGGGKLFFLDSGKSCDVEGVYAEANLGAGSYRVQLTREGDNWYRVGFGNTYVRTHMCLELAMGDEVLLEIAYFGSGKAHFLDNGNRCSIVSVYVKQGV